MPQIVRVSPSAYLMAPTPVPSCDWTTNGGIEDCADAALDALRRANADKAAIKASVTQEGK